jgi:hypothetical protein
MSAVYTKYLYMIKKGAKCEKMAPKSAFCTKDEPTSETVPLCPYLIMRAIK